MFAKFRSKQCGSRRSRIDSVMVQMVQTNVTPYLPDDKRPDDKKAATIVKMSDKMTM